MDIFFRYLRFHFDPRTHIGCDADECSVTGKRWLISIRARFMTCDFDLLPSNHLIDRFRFMHFVKVR